MSRTVVFAHFDKDIMDLLFVPVFQTASRQPQPETPCGREMGSASEDNVSPENVLRGWTIEDIGL